MWIENACGMPETAASLGRRCFRGIAVPGFHLVSNWNSSTSAPCLNRIAGMKSTGLYSRRAFVLALGASSFAMAQVTRRAVAADALDLPPVAIFSKIYQELNLGFEETAELTALAGMDGIDCPVRPGGQVLPERVADELPKLAEALQKHQKRILLLATAIRNPTTPHTEAILRTARQLGIKHYRTGYWNYRPGETKESRWAEIRAELKDLAALNHELGVCAVLQNHAGTNLVGAKVRDYYEIASAFPPSQVGIAFDIGHALNEVPDTWRAEFQRLQSHFAVAYLKDWKRGDGFVPFGEGAIGETDFFKQYKAANPKAPISLHTEYHWAEPNQPPTKAALLAALRRDLRVLKSWWAAA
jgi:sugar phosphate isomerase/epimerase